MALIYHCYRDYALIIRQNFVGESSLRRRKWENQKKRKRVRRRVKATQKAIEYRRQVAGGPKVQKLGPIYRAYPRLQTLFSWGGKRIYATRLRNVLEIRCRTVLVGSQIFRSQRFAWHLYRNQLFENAVAVAILQSTVDLPICIAR
jgi:hypothetical protein